MPVLDGPSTMNIDYSKDNVKTIILAYHDKRTQMAFLVKLSNFLHYEVHHFTYSAIKFTRF